MRTMVLVFCERRDALKRHRHVRRYINVNIADGGSTKREFMIYSVMRDLEKSV
jgi:hypothetical protein